MKRLFTAAMLLVITTISANAQLVINELMQSNVECIRDDIHEFPDSWVELYNPTDAPINLSGYQISNKNKVANAWQLPNQEVPAKGHVIIFCDKEGLEANRLHTDFRLESGKGCTVYLFKNNGSEPVDSLPYIDGNPMAKMPAPDIAYGRKTDGADEWGYQLTPTPGAANSGSVVGAKQILGAPGFSELGRVMPSSESISLELSLPKKAPGGAKIRYTMDGSEPTATSTEYTEPINISSTTVIRAKVFCNGYLSPKSTAQSYIFHPREMKVPIISIQTKGEYIYDDAFGIYPNNKDKDHQVDWRRPINIEMFDSVGKPSVINQLGETRIQGGQSRENRLKSMAIYANKRFDPDHKRFEYEFFPDQKPGVTEFKSFSLRDGGNDFEYLYFRDLIIQRTMGPNTDLDWQAGKTAVLYINGVYKGMLNIRERSNEDNIYSNYKDSEGKGLEDIDMIEIGHEKKNGQDQYIEELKEGDLENYNAFKTFYSTKGHTLAEYEEKMDVSEYLNVVIMNLFYGNIDFPGNNIVFWRPRTENGKWRFIVKDTDFGLGLYGRKPDYNTIELLYNQNYDSGNAWAFTEPATRLIKNMLEDPGILNLFIDKCCVYMGDFMNGKGTGDMIDSIKEKALDEFVAHRVEIPSKVGINSEQDIIDNFENAKKWVAGGYTVKEWGHTTTYNSRSDYFYDYIRSQWSLGTAIPVTINNDVDDAEMPDKVYVNNIKLTKGVFDGKLFKNRSITLEGKSNDDSNIYVEKWEIKTTANNQETTAYSTNATYNFNVPSCTKLSINAIVKPQVCIGQREAVSYSSTMPLDFTDQPVKAYIVIESGNKFIKKQVNKVRANTGLIVEGLSETYKIPVAAANTAFDDVTGNLLRPTAYGPVTVSDDGIYYGLFYSYDQQKVGFKKKDKGYTFPKGKSYLFLSQDHQAKEFAELFYDGIIDGIATDIQGVNNKWSDGKAYNLNGQRVDKNYNGVIIVNGKKVINNRK